MDKPQDASEKEYNEKILRAFDAEKSELKQESELLSAEEKEKLIKQKKELTALPDEFDFKHVADLNYLFEIFSSKYDKLKSLDFLTKTRENMIHEGYPDCATLNEFLFWVTMSRRLQINYQRIHAKLMHKEGIAAEEAENIDMLKEMRDISEQVGSLQKALDALREKRQQIKDVVDLHATTMKDAEEFIRTHIGEFSWKCQKCNTIINSQGLPHFAIMTEKDDQSGEIIYHIFSKELWYLFQKKLMSLHHAAFILRTSPEGFLITAQKRGEYGAQVALDDTTAIEQEENELKKLHKDYETRE
jgi:predicted O-linked N-acetylglucosamine transferase (SPINDLY family)